MAPTIGHLLWAVAAMALLAAALVLAGVGFRRPSRSARLGARGLALVAVLLDLGLICYRNLLWRWSCPIENNFDSAALFVAMLGGVLLYVAAMRVRRPPGDAAGRLPPRRSAVDLVLLPVMLLAQLAAAGVYFGGFRQFDAAGLWRPIHLATLITGALFLAAGAVAAVMYLLVDRALRGSAPGGVLGRLPSLERLAALIHHAILAGFALLTVGMVTGGLIFLRPGGHPAARVSPAKLYLSLAAWLLYAVVLGMRFWPRLRGRRVAWCAIAGFLLLLVTYALAQWSG